MALISEHSMSTGSAHGFFHRLFSGIGSVLTLMSERDARYDRILRLHAKSDEELAAMGLKREDIVRHVYRDVMAL